MRAHADDQRRALLVREEHGEILARADCAYFSVGKTKPLDPLASRRPPVRVGVDDELGAAAKRPVGGRIHVADDHVRAPSRLEDRVGASVDPDEDRPHIVDVGPERAQVRTTTGA